MIRREKSMKKKVTVQDIADELGISRNTVSKALNGTPGLAESTRELILQKAVEMGYKQFSYVASLRNILTTSIPFDAPEPGEIALLTTSYSNSHFASLLMDKFEQEMSQLNYSITSYRINETSMKKLSLPASLNLDEVSAIVCVEIFDKPFADMICSLDKPVLFIDAPCAMTEPVIDADVLLMNNMNPIREFIREMAASGKTRIGFIGDYTHCQSFFERFSAYQVGMLASGLPVNRKFILKNEDDNYDDICCKLQQMDEYPEVFICANDFVAIDAMMAIRNSGMRIPEDIGFLGFDDSYESRIFVPSLSTIHIHTQSMAYSAAQLLISRIKTPDMEKRIVYVGTDLILRKSTDF